MVRALDTCPTFNIGKVFLAKDLPDGLMSLANWIFHGIDPDTGNMVLSETPQTSHNPNKRGYNTADGRRGHHTGQPVTYAEYVDHVARLAEENYPGTVRLALANDWTRLFIGEEQQRGVVPLLRPQDSNASNDMQNWFWQAGNPDTHDIHVRYPGSNDARWRSLHCLSKGFAFRTIRPWF